MQGTTDKERNRTNQRNNIPLQFFSAKKRSLSVKVKVYVPNEQHQKLVDMCRRRWLERIDGMGIFEELFVSIYRSNEIYRLK